MTLEQRPVHYTNKQQQFIYDKRGLLLRFTFCTPYIQCIIESLVLGETQLNSLVPKDTVHLLPATDMAPGKVLSQVQGRTQVEWAFSSNGGPS